MQNDDILITNILNGNMDSFSTLVFRYENRIYKFLIKLTSCREDAEEIMQDVFIRVYNYLYRYDSKWSFSTWIYSIAFNSFKDYYKKKRKLSSKKYDYQTGDYLETCSYMEEDYETKELYAEVVKLINSLKYDQKTALILKHIQGFSYNEIAKILGVSSDNARMKVLRAKKAISDGILKLKRGTEK
ncbi:UNVERIFIED_CONTAM: RNA polymerase sigma-70 factor (ECF subfamily) [Acetivibrio alkalicellulosi]